jgi:periplasmic protein CpxP/Spy
VAVAAAAALSQPALAMPSDGPGARHAMHERMMGGPGMGLPMGPMGMMGMKGLGDRLLDELKATPEQRTQIRTLMDAAHTDLQAQRESGRALREQAMSVFSQPTVDARAAETLRQQMLAQHDTASKRTTQLMLDLSRVLTPEQRKQMAERMAQRGERMQRHMREQREQRDQRPQRPQS